MPEWLQVVGMGILGGLAADLVAGGFLRPYSFVDVNGRERTHPGTLAAVFIGALAAIVFWGLYHPLVGGLLAGFAGERVLRSHADQLLGEVTRNNEAESIAELVATIEALERQVVSLTRQLETGEYEDD